MGNPLTLNREILPGDTLAGETLSQWKPSSTAILFLEKTKQNKYMVILSKMETLSSGLLFRRKPFPRKKNRYSRNAGTLRNGLLVFDIAIFLTSFVAVVEMRHVVNHARRTRTRRQRACPVQTATYRSRAALPTSSSHRMPGQRTAQNSRATTALHRA